MIAALAGASLVAACGPATAPPPPTPTPLPTAQLRQQYLAAAATYDEASAPVARAENTYCAGGAPAADLSQCERALSSDRLATVAFDDAIRQLRFPQPAQAAAGRLLADDAELEALQQQASTAPSLTAIAALTPQILQLLVTSARDADAVRAAIGLPVSSPTPTPSA